ILRRALLITAVTLAFSTLITSSSALDEKKGRRGNLVGLDSADRGFPVVVNYDLSLKEMIALGKYDNVVLSEDDISNISWFLRRLEGGHEARLNIELLSLPNGLRVREILRILGARGMRPATVRELLSLGA